MQRAGLEPTCLATHRSERCLSTNFNTVADDKILYYMKPNISKYETDSGHKIIESLSKSNNPLLPFFLKDFIPEYKKFKAHHQKYHLWSSYNNKNQQKYDKIVLLSSGIAAGGKDAIKEEIFKISRNMFTRVVTATSRPPREGETDTKDYYLYNRQSFFQSALRR